MKKKGINPFIYGRKDGKCSMTKKSKCVIASALSIMLSFSTVLQPVSTTYASMAISTEQAIVLHPDTREYNNLTEVNNSRPSGYVTIDFQYAVPQGKKGEVSLPTRRSTVFWVKSGTTWDQLAQIAKDTNNEAFYLPDAGENDHDWLLCWAINNDHKTKPVDLNDLGPLKGVAITNDLSVGKLMDDYVQIKNSAEDQDIDASIERIYGISKKYLNIITLDAVDGAINGQRYSHLVTAKNKVDYSFPKLQQDIVSQKPTKAGSSFVRWQSDTNEKIPTSGTISRVTYKALYLVHPTQKVTVFNKKNLTTTDMENLKKAILDANADTKKLIEDIVVSPNGETVVKYIGGDEVVLSVDDLATENQKDEKDFAKSEIEKAASKKEKEINSSNLTQSEKKQKIDELKKIKDEAINNIDAADTATKLEKALTDGKNKIAAIDTKSKPSGGSGSTSSSTTTPNKPSSSKLDNERISGSDRIKTAVELSKKNFSSAKTVIIVNKDTYPDALTATVLAKLLNAPILLTDNNNLSATVKDEIKRLGASEVVVVGGVTSVSSGVEKQLSVFDSSVERIGGEDRYKTSALVAKRINGLTNINNKAVIASGEVFADALTVSPMASRDNMPILLVKKNDVTTQTVNILDELKVSKVYIVGGYSTVSKSVEIQLPSLIKRIGGNDRYETATKIADYSYKTATKGYIASGEVFADALVAGPVASKDGAPILLVKSNDTTKYTKDYVVSSYIRNLVILGGTNSISNSVVDQLVRK